MRFSGNIFILIVLIVFNGYSAVIINHNSVAEFDAITQQQADSVRDLNIVFSHRSVGRTIMYGLQDLGNQNSKYLLQIMPDPDEWQTAGVKVSDYTNYGPIFGHLNQDVGGLAGFFNFALQNDSFLDVGIVKRCFVDMYGSVTAASLFAEYKGYIDDFLAQNPDITLVVCTLPLTIDTDALNAERSKYRDLVLAEYGNANVYIYDIADIESWYNDAYTTFEYGGNTYLRIHDSYTDDEGHPNTTGRVPLAKAMWVLLSKIAQSSSGLVNDPPVAVNDAATTPEDTPVVITVLTNDYDVDGVLVPSTVAKVTDPGHGTAVVNTSTGEITYTPSVNYNGADSFTYHVHDDSNAVSNTATVNITVTAVNDAPVVEAIPDQTINEGGTFTTISLDNYVSDVDNTDAQLSWSYTGNVNLTVSINPSTRVATITTPNANWYGNESITFTATDPGLLNDNDPAAFTVLSVNDAPLAAADTVTTDEDTPVAIQVLNNDADIDGVLVLSSVAVQSGPAHGNTSVNTTTGIITYTPAGNYNGGDSFTYTVRDDNNAVSNAATVTITIAPLNDAPVFINLPDTVKFYHEEDLVLSDYVQDADLPDDSLHWQFSASDDMLQLQFDAATAELVLSATEFIGIINLRLTVTDDSGAVAMDSVVVNVIAGPTGILPDFALTPRQYEMYQNYPNPFNPVTRIKFGLPYAGRVKIEMYNMLGQQVRVLVDEVKQPGYHVVEFNAATLPSGIYFCRLHTDKYNKVMKIILLK